MAFSSSRDSQQREGTHVNEKIESRNWKNLGFAPG